MRVRARYATTISLGDYQFARPEVELEDDVKDGESIGDTYQRLFDMARYLAMNSILREAGDVEAISSGNVSDVVGRILSSTPEDVVKGVASVNNESTT